MSCVEGCSSTKARDGRVLMLSSLVAARQIDADEQTYAMRDEKILLLPLECA